MQLFTLWAMCITPPARWCKLDSNLSERSATKRVAEGNSLAERFETTLIYKACPVGQNPFVEGGETKSQQIA